MFRLFNTVSVRQYNFFVFFCVCALLFYAFFSVVFLDLEACPLCVTQQFFFLLTGIITFIALLHNPSLKVFKIYSIFTMVMVIAGMAVAARQLWLQSLPADLVPVCGPSLEYILEVFPFSDILKSLFIGDGSCAEVTWSFLGFSMAGWSFIWFSLFFLVNIVILIKK